MSFDLLIEGIKKLRNPTVAGLDPKFSYVPSYIRKKFLSQFEDPLEGAAMAVLEYNKGLIDALYDMVPAVKLQAAYYELYGWAGLKTMKETIDYARQKGMYVIIDGKRNDIGSTMEAYAAAHLGQVDIDGKKVAPFHGDALTVNGYLGSDGISPLLSVCKEEDKGIFVLVKTSNPSSGELQDKEIDGTPVYELMGQMCEHWGDELPGKYGYSGVGAVVGATYPEQLSTLRKKMPHTFFLVPGYGAQGGGAKDVAGAFDENGLGAIVNSSRGIICAYQKEGCDEQEYAAAARREAIRMRDDILQHIRLEQPKAEKPALEEPDKAVPGKKAWLLLADGTLFEGKSFGAEGASIGEVIFSTSMAGYQEDLTDPTYYGQILTQTFPLIGNYGVNSEDMSSERCFLHGYIVREWCENPSNFRCEGDIDKFLKEQGVIGLCGIDTRSLTKILREKGAMNGLITTEPISDKTNTLKKIAKYTVKNAVRAVTENTPLVGVSTTLGPSAQCRVGILNLGCCRYLVDELRDLDCDIVVFNPNQPVSSILDNKIDGIILSEGPGDPNEDKEILKTIKALADNGIPMMGIGLGHEMLALAMDMKCRRMPHGHRGASQPVLDTWSGKTYVTSQNHGYVVNKETVDDEVASIRYLNANDQSCEGLSYKEISAFSVQFRPQGDDSDQDTAFLYDEFVEMIKRQSGREWE